MKTTVKPAYRSSDRMHVKRRALMLSCATLAIASAVMAPREARAQAFNGTMAPTSGVTQTFTGTGAETVTVSSPTTTINWAPNEAGTGNIVFLPSSNTATFTSSSGITDYTVLNRIVPLTDATRAIELNGTVMSTLEGSSTIGGNVWFYSPGGIVVGSTAVFDVGGLLLSTIDLSSFSNDSNGFTASFAKTQPGAGAIQILPGAQIDASLQQNSYVALVAPRIEQGGAVRVDGAAAFVAAEQLTMTMNQGLFDIQVGFDGGTGDANGIVHTGSTGGPAQADASDNHRIYMVAVPKNQAMTMLLGGDIGFDASLSASVKNGSIYIGSGILPHESSGGFTISTSANQQSGITLQPGNFTSDLQGWATGDIYASADSGSLSFAGDLKLTSYLAGASGNVTVGASNGNSLTVAGGLNLWTSAATFASGISVGASSGGTLTVDGSALFTALGAADATPSWVDLYAYNGGSVTIGGSTYFTTNIGAESPNPDLASSDNYAGDVSIDSWGTGSSITLGSVYIEASADGQDNFGNGDGSAGDAYGGDVSINANSGGSVSMASLYASVDGRGGAMLDGGLAGGAGYGGNISIGVGDGAVSVAGNMFLSALGIGGSYDAFATPSSAIGGTGDGGSIWAEVWGPGSFDVGGFTTMRADGTGGSGQTGGSGYGGNAGITARDGTADFGDASITVVGSGGDASVGFGGNGGLGEGGTGYVEARGNAGDGIEVPPSTSTITGGNVTIDASGVGGFGGASNGDSIAAGSGGTGSGGLYTGQLGTGGAFAASSNGSTIQLGNVTLTAQGSGGAGGAGLGIVGGGAGGDAFGGSAEMGNYGPIGTASTATYGNVTLAVSAFGGDGGAGGTGQGTGGNATAGGSIYDEAQNRWGGAYVSAIGDVTVGSATLYAQAFGGDGSTGGDAIGGITQAASWNDTSSVLNVAGALNLDSYAIGGSGDFGGNGTGGYSGLAVIGGATGATLTVGGVTTLVADGEGGAGVAAGGSGTGGFAEIVAESGLLDTARVNAFARGFGGAGENNGGAGTGGDIVFAIAAGGSLDATMLNMIASGYGGNSASGSAGTGLGGTFTGVIEGAVVATDFVGQADGIGGASDNGAGGSAQGGATGLTIDDGSFSVSGTSVVTADGVGGAGATGGSGQGGETTVAITANGGSISITGFSAMSANGYGGAGRDNADGTGGTGGNGYGGAVLIDIPTALAVGATASLNLGDLSLTGMGFGGDGGTGVTGGLGGNGYGGTADVNIGSGTATLGSTTVRAAARGGSGGAGSTGAGGAGGAAVGGSSNLTVAGSLDAQYYFTNSHGFGGAGGTGTTAGAGGAAAAGSTGVRVLAGGNANFVDGMIATSAAFGGEGSTGGAAQAGTSAVNVEGSLTSAGTVQSSAQAFGGLGLSGAGGDATSGSASLDVSGDVDAALLYVATNAIGGDGATAGGNALAGSSMLTVTGSATVVNASVEAKATGGNASAGVGGDGSAGIARLSILGSWISTGEATVVANGLGGDGAAGGGTGFGNDAAVRVYDGGTAQFSGGLTLTATGTGGTSANGTGGDGFGGYARMSAYLNTAQGGTIIANNVTVDSSGIGGGGVDGGDGIARDSIDGWGGSVLQAFGAGSSMTLTGQTNVVSSGTGGDGTTGIGGNATAGYAALAAIGTATVAAGSVLIEANGAGGLGAGGNGTGSGGTASFRSHDGASLVGADITLLALGSTAGGLVEILATGGADTLVDSLSAAADGDLSAGQVVVGVEYDSTIDLGTALLSASGGPGGDITVDIGGGATAEALSSGDILFADSLTIDSSGTIDVLSQNGAGIDVTNMFAATAAGLVNLDDQSSGALLTAATMNLAGSDILFDWGFDVFDIALAVSGDYTLAGLPTAQNSLSVSAGGSLTLGDFYSEQSLALEAGTDLIAGDVGSGGSLSLAAGGSVSAGDLTADGNLTVSADGNIVAGALTAGGGVAASAAGTLTVGSVTSGYIAPPPPPSSGFGIQAAAVATGQNVTLSSSGDVTTGDINSAEGITLDAGGTLTTGNLGAVTGIAARAVGDTRIGNAAAGQDLTVSSAANLTTGNLSAGGAATLSGGPSITTGTVSGSSVAMTGQGSVSAGDIQSANTVDIVAAGNLTLSGVSAATSATLTSGGVASFLGLVSAPVITVTSADLHIGDSGQLGEAGVTDVLNLFATSDSPVIIGGAEGEDDQYQLSQEEVERIEAASVLFTARGSGGTDPDVIVHDLTIGGSQTEGGGVGQVVLTTGGNIIVDGDVLYANAAATDSLSLNAGNSIQVITDTGSLAMTASDGSLSGELLLTADNIWVGDQALIDQLTTDPNFAGRDSALATNNGAVNPDGYVGAGGITAKVAESLLVQNSGTAEDPGGMTVGDGGLTVNNAGAQPATVVAYGRKVNGDGTVVGGDDFGGTVEFTGNGTSDGSTINGCDVGNGCAVVVEPPPPPPPPPTTDDPPVLGPESILGPVGLMTSSTDAAGSDDGAGDSGGDETESDEDDEAGSEDQGSVDPSVQLINSGPLQLDQLVDQPVTSGSDAILNDGPGGTN